MGILADFLCTNINSSFKPSSFRSCVKMADVSPLHKECKKENHRPVSILPVISKVFERSMFPRISSFFVNYLSEQQCGLWKGSIVHNNVIGFVRKMEVIVVKC